MSQKTGRIVAINGNMITVAFVTSVIQNEVAFALLNGNRLKSEVIRVRGDYADLQVFEDTRGLKVGDAIEFTGQLLAVQLGPGLLGKVFDGLQNPLPELAEQCGFFLKRGTYLPSLKADQRWAFTPTAAVGDEVRAGMFLGHVPEGIFEHRIMAPFALHGTWRVKEIAAAGSYATTDRIAVLQAADGRTHEVSMTQMWPVKIALRAYKERLRPT